MGPRAALRPGARERGLDPERYEEEEEEEEVESSMSEAGVGRCCNIEDQISANPQYCNRSSIERLFNMVTRRVLVTFGPLKEISVSRQA